MRKEIPGIVSSSKRQCDGIISHSFYRINTRGDTKDTFLGRSKSNNMEPFIYETDKDGKLVIVGTK